MKTGRPARALETEDLYFVLPSKHLFSQASADGSGSSCKPLRASRGLAASSCWPWAAVLDELQGLLQCLMWWVAVVATSLLLYPPPSLSTAPGHTCSLSRSADPRGHGLQAGSPLWPGSVLPLAPGHCPSDGCICPACQPLLCSRESR